MRAEPFQLFTAFWRDSYLYQPMWCSFPPE